MKEKPYKTFYKTVFEPPIYRYLLIPTLVVFGGISIYYLNYFLTVSNLEKEKAVLIQQKQGLESRIDVFRDSLLIDIDNPSSRWRDSVYRGLKEKALLEDKIISVDKKLAKFKGN